VFADAQANGQERMNGDDDIEARIPVGVAGCLDLSSWMFFPSGLLRKW
jgi:hypothetical protein